MATYSIRKDGSYYIRHYVGTVGGKRKNAYMTWRPEPGMTPRQIKNKLENVMKEFEFNCENGKMVDNKTTFEKYVNETYLPRMKKQLKKTTYSRYNSLLKRIIPALGPYKMKDIESSIVEKLIIDLGESPKEDSKYLPNAEACRISKLETRGEVAYKSGISTTTVDAIRSGKKINRDSAKSFAKYADKPIYKLFSTDDECISSRTVLHHYRLIFSIMEAAVHDKTIQENPCKFVYPPKVDAKEARYLDEEDIEILLKTLDEKSEHPFDVIIKLLLYTGMRRGEVCALQWTDIDFNRCLIDINKSLLYLPEEGVFESTTKNKSSNRVIKVGDSIMELLRDYKLWQSREAIELGDKWKGSNRVFTSWNGSDINPGTVTKYLHRLVTENDLPYISVHGLRHTNASIMLLNHIPITTAAERLGHSTSVTTSRIYAHALKSADAVASDVIDIALAMKKNN